MWLWILLSFFLLISIGITVYFIFFRDTSNCSSSWDQKTCAFISEKYLDSTLITPNEPLYLGDLIFNKTSNPPFCTNTWYAYRAVRESDGGYSNLSPWFGPIRTGSSNNPCYPMSGSQSSNPQGNNCAQDKILVTLNANQPTIVTVDPLNYNISQGIYYNVHRIVSDDKPSSTDTGDIIGFLITYPYQGKNWTSYCVDAVIPVDSTATICNTD